MREEVPSMVKEVSSDYLAKIKETMLKDADTAAKDNNHWLHILNMDYTRGIDMQTDTCDMGQHLNVYGAEKLSRWFGSELKTRYALADRRGDEALDAAYRTLTERYETEKLRLTEGN